MSRHRRVVTRVAAVTAAATMVPLLTVRAASATVHTVTLTASATDVPPGSPVVLTARSSIDVGPTAFSIHIVDTTTNTRVAFCGEGTTCTGHVGHFTTTTRTYVAVLAEGSASPPSVVVATSHAVSVRWSFAASTSAVTGAVGFKAMATLPRFPCPPPPPYGDGPCTGSLQGRSYGHLAGTNGLDAFGVTWEGTSAGNLVASFAYSEWACDGTENVLGSAFGSGTASALRPSVFGWYKVADEPFTRPILGIRGTFAFDWLRHGTTAAISFETFDVYVTVDGLGERRILTGSRLGAAAFALSHVDPAGPPTCASPMTDVEGEVVGTIRVT